MAVVEVAVPALRRAALPVVDGRRVPHVDVLELRPHPEIGVGDVEEPSVRAEAEPRVVQAELDAVRVLADDELLPRPPAKLRFRSLGLTRESRFRLLDEASRVRLELAQHRLVGDELGERKRRIAIPAQAIDDRLLGLVEERRLVRVAPPARAVREHPVLHRRLLEDRTGERLSPRIAARAPQEADVEAAQWTLVPGDALADVVHGSLVIAGAEDGPPTVQPLRALGGPRVERGEVVELGDRARRRREVARSRLPLRLELDAVQHVRRDLEHAVVATRQQLLAKAREAARVVELVAVDAEDPSLGPRVHLDQLVRRSRMAYAVCVDMLVLVSECAQHLPGPVGGDVVDGVDPVAEGRRVPDRLLNEQILVANEHDPDDLPAHRPSSERSLSSSASRRRWTRTTYASPSAAASAAYSASSATVGVGNASGERRSAGAAKRRGSPSRSSLRSVRSASRSRVSITSVPSASPRATASSSTTMESCCCSIRPLCSAP